MPVLLLGTLHTPPGRRFWLNDATTTSIKVQFVIRSCDRDRRSRPRCRGVSQPRPASRLRRACSASNPRFPFLPSRVQGPVHWAKPCRGGAPRPTDKRLRDLGMSKWQEYFSSSFALRFLPCERKPPTTRRRLTSSDGRRSCRPKPRTRIYWADQTPRPRWFRRYAYISSSRFCFSTSRSNIPSATHCERSLMYFALRADRPHRISSPRGAFASVSGAGKI